jgi:uncharacterized membrane protein
VKKTTVLIFFIALLLLFNTAYAQVQYYSADIAVDEKGMSTIKLTITFSDPEKSFNFNVIGKIQNFNATSNAGQPSCSVVVSGISLINCNMSLTTEKRTLGLMFETSDFVKALDNKFYLDADLGINRDIQEIFVSARLPEGMALVSENVTGRLSFPENATYFSDGRRIIVLWKISNIQSTQPLRFQILYEQVRPQYLQLWYLIVLGLVTITLLTYIVLRFLKRPEKLILSVLDEYERKVMDAIVHSGGSITQKKVVKETNLSKAKVSRVVKSLAERGVIEVERAGRTNNLKTTKKRFKFFF